MEEVLFFAQFADFQLQMRFFLFVLHIDFYNQAYLRMFIYSY